MKKTILLALILSLAYFANSHEVKDVKITVAGTDEISNTIPIRPPVG
ncbi:MULTISPECIES: hypothetical protein [Paenisporosarcina]|jgi:hypothetical protein|uniref:Uncharacterized protein n=1 Tax=Paenisporosarcina quisquiliarum TaxID=365346 RepID=A0A9X3LGI7_9BACL|nr:hypothetical protein [Paenisporosarcina quisquiliarum]MCZ8537297.1 hypothetical protein [Paenisporosarcina quisquiliarum]